MNRIVRILCGICISFLVISCKDAREEKIEELLEVISHWECYYMMPEYKAYCDSVAEIASVEELVDICTKSNYSVVRAAMFKSLMKKDIHTAVDVALKNISDTASFTWVNYEESAKSEVSGHRFYQLYRYGDNYDITTMEKERIDSTLLFTFKDQISHYPFYDMCMSIHPNPMFYDILKEMSVTLDKDRLNCIWVALARYKKNEDKKVILRFIKNSSDEYEHKMFKFIVSEWPSAEFRPFAEMAFNTKYQTEEDFLALMAYNDNSAYDMIKKTLENEPDSLPEGLFIPPSGNFIAAYQKCPRTIFAPLFKFYTEEKEREFFESSNE